MNVPRTLTRPDVTSTSATLAASMSFDERATSVNVSANGSPVPNGNIKETQSVPNLSALTQELPNNMASLRMNRDESKSISSSSGTRMPAAEVIDKQSESISEKPDPVSVVPEAEPVAPEFDGDPLGVMASMSKKVEPTPRLDFAAFASQNAFRDR